MRKLLYWFIRKVKVHTDILKIKECESQITMAENSKFYEEAIVCNHSGDKSKIRIGRNSHVRGELTVYPYSKGLYIGDDSFVGVGSVIRSAAKLVIGDRVLIGHNVNIIDTNSHEIDYKERHNGFIYMLEFGHPSSPGEVLIDPITIEDDVWISYGVSILKGVKIGRGAIIGACSVVTKDVNPFTLVAGNPAIVIKELNQE